VDSEQKRVLVFERGEPLFERSDPGVEEDRYSG
jgi:hypothetical protein